MRGIIGTSLQFRFLVVTLAAVVMLVVFLIPHSVLGSEYKY